MFINSLLNNYDANIHPVFSDFQIFQRNNLKKSKLFFRMNIYIGKNIRFLRVKNDVTQDKIGEWIGKSGKTIGSYENGGAEPNITALSIFSKKFGLTVDSLLFQDLEFSDLSENTGELNEPPPQYKPEKKAINEGDLNEKRYELLLIEIEALRKRLEMVEQELKKKK